MDRMALVNWRNELEARLAEVEKSVSKLEAERAQIKAQITAIAVLTSSAPQHEEPVAVQQSGDPTDDFMSWLRGQGWSIEHGRGRAKEYKASRAGDTVQLCAKFSSYSDKTEKYWFGLNPDMLINNINKSGGVMLLLGTREKHLGFSFAKISELLKDGTKTKTGQKDFQIRQVIDRWELQPSGSGKWIDVSAYYGSNGLRQLGLGV